MQAHIHMPAHTQDTHVNKLHFCVTIYESIWQMQE